MNGQNCRKRIQNEHCISWETSLRDTSNAVKLLRTQTLQEKTSSEERPTKLTSHGNHGEEPLQLSLPHHTKSIVSTGYKDTDGNIITVPPTAAEGYEKITPVYEEMPGWSEVTVGATSRDALPANAIAYIARIEELTGVPVDIISTGPDRVETMVLRNPFA